MNKLILTQTQPGHWQLAGELSFNSLSAYSAMLASERPHTGKWLISCDQLQRIDSAGLAYLLDCARFAEWSNVELKIVGLTQDVYSLMQIQGVASLLQRYLEGNYAKND